MEDGRPLPPEGGVNAKLSATAIKSECKTAVTAIRKEQNHPEISTQMRVRKNDLCDVPCKVPRFQYVDFPSLHQCIQQLSVPPMNVWLGSCSLAPKAPNHSPTSPKEKVPKFKYVDYPSLHHCIQQLSVPPLESWSVGLVKHNAEGRHEGSGLQKIPAQPGTVRNNQRTKKNKAGDQYKEITACSFPNTEPCKLINTHTNSGMSKEERPVGGPQQGYSSDKKRLPERVEKDEPHLKFSARKPDVDLGSDCASRLESGFGSQTDTRVIRNCRPSVISMVHTDKQKQWIKTDHIEEHWNPSDPEWVPWNFLQESVCPFCQQMFTNPEQFRAHQWSHIDKRPN